ncbi:phosphotransferase [Paenibacillus sp. MMS20-IR301]|uniref:phosphotransferase n=1 Tax=Paenibacillus sp. MMS20-IR301 TaxID=2895946 RepID=UPI0028E1F636|nr:phosphotransferase [Paenibacillus sp. MMS20-IR301]WNS45954.1 phosphotransferase [Paenibacillus sp. MMS20-IR301]
MSGRNELWKQMIEDRLQWDMQDTAIEYQQDGLTNQNYIIKNGPDRLALRISGSNADRLGINREAELAAMQAAAAIGVGAEIVYFSTETGHMITKVIEGRKWSDADAGTAVNMKRIADTLRKVHEMPAIPFEFSPYRDIEDRIRYCGLHQLGLPGDLDKLLDKLAAIEEARAAEGLLHGALCHNDPFPNNFLDDGNVRLIDWEYAGMGDILFDLACVCASYSPAQKESFLTHYFGQCDAATLHSLEQMSYVVTFWNAMWAVLQTHTLKPVEAGVSAEPPADYRQMADWMFARLRETL